MDKIGIIGFGEIGKGLNNVYLKHGYNPSILDPFLQIQDDLNKCDILNVCIPYSDNFFSIVQKYIDDLDPKLTVIHSTVHPGTTRKINGKVLHSPVRGLHPNLDTGIQTFLKYIGSEDLLLSEHYQTHLESLGISSHICKDSLTTEYAKLLDTSYYGLCIAFHNEVNKICENNSIDFEEVMTIYNSSYNDGYQTLGKRHFMRPTLYAGTKIGGHCVIPNLEILINEHDCELFRGILKYK